jgi:hypothetical protein
MQNTARENKNVTKLSFTVCFQQDNVM